MQRKKGILHLCAGLQSGGTTLISWCFLQRADMNGILDANNDIFAELPDALDVPHAWIKTTISSFRLSEQIAHFEDQGWSVCPLLICRDVREAYASLRTKKYGNNGTTAEDPPLRLRFRRFREDWDLFCRKDWPILHYEHFLLRPEAELRQACVRLELPWDAAMMSWPKPRTAILDTRHGNQTFRRNCGNGLLESLAPAQSSRQSLILPAEDLAWLESEFAHFNRVNGYLAHLGDNAISAGNSRRDVPSYQVTRRSLWRRQLKPIPLLLLKMAGWFKRKPALVPSTRVVPWSERDTSDVQAAA